MKEEYMLEAIKQAEIAAKHNEIPVGAIIVYKDKIIAKAYNKKEKKQNVLEHAELIAIRKASKIIKNWRLSDCELYVTLEPCPMCASAIKQSRIKTVYAGLKSNDINNEKIIKMIFNNNYNNGNVTYNCGYFSEDIEKLMQNFFKNKRNVEK